MPTINQLQVALEKYNLTVPKDLLEEKYSDLLIKVYNILTRVGESTVKPLEDFLNRISSSTDQFCSGNIVSCTPPLSQRGVVRAKLTGIIKNSLLLSEFLVYKFQVELLENIIFISEFGQVYTPESKDIFYGFVDHIEALAPDISTWVNEDCLAYRDAVYNLFSPQMPPAKNPDLSFHERISRSKNVHDVLKLLRSRNICASKKQRLAAPTTKLNLPSTEETLPELLKNLADLN